MNVEKAKKRIAKQVGKGFKGYPVISLTYYGQRGEVATDVVIQFISEEGAEPQEQTFTSQGDVRNDEEIQTVLLKIIERADACSVIEQSGVSEK